ncbi:IS110 family transposase [Arthrobacter sp. MMS18-M83]|uniref:IS110 family transposase n=1 Tax=Arthrobacter sp. MMS18-M83 TaxID=2996261 RepID=UPI00227ABFBB|nr:IS110 family transposase [Arthrobacter sp. MMS18-M83]WAH96036.1 IS110 family transposase [Arthrobacter sp. MMS18-M83]WAH98911.1 IS110 family transposase [Arthrobacter sp. MMS18-M83]WAH99433.1 IS110 family transposase [Arthrobacter sp. MMS18-M83]
MANEATDVIVGIDTHADTHHVAVITGYGKPLADREFLAVGSGYRKILDFIASHGTVTAVGIEGTGSYGAELARTLRGEGLTVLEVNRPNRAERRLKGKSDPLDAYQAAQSVLAERGISVPKAKDGPVECLRILRTARSSAAKARTVAVNQIKGLLVSAPEGLRAKYRGLGTPALIMALQRARPSGHVADPEYMTLLTLKALAVRYHSLAAEIAAADASLQEILDTYAPMLCDLTGVGTEVASQLLVTVGDNPDRIGSEPQFAALVGAAPIPASSGKTTRHRLSRGGDRNANRALHQVVLVRMSSCRRTRDYVNKRTAEGKSKREIMRCLKRYVAREIYRQITNPQPAPSNADLRQQRTKLGFTINAAAGHLGQWPSVISRLERGLIRNDSLAATYRQWLADQTPQNAN